MTLTVTFRRKTGAIDAEVDDLRQRGIRSILRQLQVVVAVGAVVRVSTDLHFDLRIRLEDRGDVGACPRRIHRHAA